MASIVPHDAIFCYFVSFFLFFWSSISSVLLSPENTYTHRWLRSVLTSAFTVSDGNYLLMLFFRFICNQNAQPATCLTTTLNEYNVRRMNEMNNKNDVCVCACVSNGEYFIHTVLHEEAAHIFAIRQRLSMSFASVWSITSKFSTINCVYYFHMRFININQRHLKQQQHMITTQSKNQKCSKNRLNYTFVC